ATAQNQYEKRKDGDPSHKYRMMDSTHGRGRFSIRNAVIARWSGQSWTKTDAILGFTIDQVNVGRRLPALKFSTVTTFGGSSKRLFPEIPFACLVRFRGASLLEPVGS
ncbi:MAG: hypothetical protein WCA20_00305, partial [Candidatus Sulfotelmatobacter sp.]